MTNDIVTQLRYIYSQKDVGVSVNPETFTEAADEIERLRAEIERMAGLLWEFAENTDEDKSATMFILHRAVMKIEKPVKP